MSRNLTAQFLRETEIALASAVSISDVTRIARVACGYRVTQRGSAHVEYTASDYAWFRKSLRGAL